MTRPQSQPQPSNADLQASIQQLVATVAQLSAQVTSVDARIEQLASIQRAVYSIGAEVTEVKRALNDLDQDSRGSSIRIIGLSISDTELQGGHEKAIMKKAYDKIIKPILNAAKANGEIDSVPLLLNVLESGRFVSKPFVDKKGRTLPPVCCVKFCNRYVRNTVMRLKKEHLPDPSVAEIAAGTGRYLLVEDLTVTNAQKLKEFREHDRVERAWSIDGRIRYTVVGSVNTVRRLPSPYISVEEALALPT